MGSVKRDIDKGRHLADLIDYSSPASMKRAFRSMFRLQARAESGCPTASAILVDLKSGLGEYCVDEIMGRRVLTSRQRQAITLHLVYDMSVEDTAAKMGTDPSNVSHAISGGIKRITEFLSTGCTGPARWENWELETLRNHYRNQGAKYVAKLVGRPVSQVYSKAKRMPDLANG